MHPTLTAVSPAGLCQHQRFENDPQNEAQKVARMHEQPPQAGGLGGGRAAGGSVVGEVDLGDQAEGETASKRCGHGNKGAGLSE